MQIREEAKVMGLRIVAPAVVPTATTASQPAGRQACHDRHHLPADRAGRAQRRHPLRSMSDPARAVPHLITDRLEHWAQEAPDRTFLARRDADGAWQRLTYLEALRRTRAVAQALLIASCRRIGP